MEKLTNAQKKALSFIRLEIDRNGTSPTLREVCEYMGYKAIGSAQDVIKALRKKGFLAYPEKQSARSLSLTNKARSIKKDFFSAASRARELDETSGVCVVPCLGTVPAGNPLEAIEARIGTLCIFESALARPKPSPEKLFAVRAQGVSMIDAGILDGDWLIVSSQNEAEVGSVVIARLDGDVTCKRLMRGKSGDWFLKPENRDFREIYARDSGFEIIGRVVALQRAF